MRESFSQFWYKEGVRLAQTKQTVEWWAKCTRHTAAMLRYVQKGHDFETRRTCLYRAPEEGD